MRAEADTATVAVADTCRSALACSGTGLMFWPVTSFVDLVKQVLKVRVAAPNTGQFHPGFLARFPRCAHLDSLG
jgi:hypothetical protein